MSCKNKNCGCNDSALTTGTPCDQGTFTCPDPEQCPETFSDCCVVHNGDSIVELNINKGERFCDILQRLILASLYPGCVGNAGDENFCGSVVGLHSIVISSTTIKIGWNAIPSALGYQVEYKAESAFSWLLNPSTTVAQDTIGGLTPNTNYYIRVKTICDNPATCYSLTIIVKTKA